MSKVYVGDNFSDALCGTVYDSITDAIKSIPESDAQDDVKIWVGHSFKESPRTKEKEIPCL